MRTRRKRIWMTIRNGWLTRDPLLRHRLGWFHHNSVMCGEPKCWTGSNLKLSTLQTTWAPDERYWTTRCELIPRILQPGSMSGRIRRSDDPIIPLPRMEKGLFIIHFWSDGLLIRDGEGTKDCPLKTKSVLKMWQFVCFCYDITWKIPLKLKTCFAVPFRHL